MVFRARLDDIHQPLSADDIIDLNNFCLHYGIL